MAIRANDSLPGRVQNRFSPTVANSPLRDRTIFIEGLPRSGTTLFCALMASHPEIAGVTAESRLFDQGIDGLFDNFESNAFGSHLSAFVSREQLQDLVRKLADGVLLEMKARVKPEATFVLEKSPVSPHHPEVTLLRKLAVFPDAWFIHIYREQESVERSIARAPWNPSRSANEVKDWQRSGLDAIRSTLRGRDRFREVRFEDLVASPAEVVSELLEWLGLQVRPEERRRIEQVSRIRFSELPKTSDPSVPRKPRSLRRWRRPEELTVAGESGLQQVVQSFLAAARDADAQAVGDLTHADFRLRIYLPAGDTEERGEGARSALLAVSKDLFGGAFMHEKWGSLLFDRKSAFVPFSGVRPTGLRTDAWWIVEVNGLAVSQAVLLSAGPLEGRESHLLAL